VVQEPLDNGLVYIADLAVVSLKRLAELNDYADVITNRSRRIALFIEKSNVGIDIWRQRPQGSALGDFGWNMFGNHPLTVAT
jgi:hypothetical protein